LEVQTKMLFHHHRQLVSKMFLHQKWELKIDESNNLCELELTMMIVYNSNVEIIFNIDWKFWSKNDGLNCFRIYIH
jgi:hypothetical protein